MLATWAERWLSAFVARYGLSIRTPEKTTFPILDSTKKCFLHVGCGGARKQHTVRGFGSDNWHEVRLDADPSVQPEIVASMTDMFMVPDCAVNAIYSSHNLEHLYPGEVNAALREFYRVLGSDGFVVITCPDLQSAATLIAEDKLTDVAYVSPAGPITPLDIVYGMQTLLRPPAYFMAHRTGFTLRSLIAAVKEVGFVSFYGIRRPEQFDLWLIAHKRAQSSESLELHARDFLPTN